MDKLRGEEQPAGEERAPDRLGHLWYSVAEVAGTLNVTAACIRRWCRIGLIGSIRIGKYRRIPITEIERLARESTLPALTTRWMSPRP